MKKGGLTPSRNKEIFFIFNRFTRSRISTFLHDLEKIKDKSDQIIFIKKHLKEIDNEVLVLYFCKILEHVKKNTKPLKIVRMRDIITQNYDPGYVGLEKTQK